MILMKIRVGRVDDIYMLRIIFLQKIYDVCLENDNFWIVGEI